MNLPPANACRHLSPFCSPASDPSATHSALTSLTPATDLWTVFGSTAPLKAQVLSPLHRAPEHQSCKSCQDMDDLSQTMLPFIHTYGFPGSRDVHVSFLAREMPAGPVLPKVDFFAKYYTGMR